MLPPLYPADAIKPLKEELVQCGFQELSTPAEVDAAVTQKGTTLVFVNAVCGCAGGTWRRGPSRARGRAGRRPNGTRRKRTNCSRARRMPPSWQ